MIEGASSCKAKSPAESLRGLTGALSVLEGNVNHSTMCAFVATLPHCLQERRKSLEGEGVTKSLADSLSGFSCKATKELGFPDDWARRMGNNGVYERKGPDGKVHPKLLEAWRVACPDKPSRPGYSFTDPRKGNAGNSVPPPLPNKEDKWACRMMSTATYLLAPTGKVFQNFARAHKTYDELSKEKWAELVSWKDGG